MNEKLSNAYNRLHHLSMRYAGAFVELLHGKPMFGLPYGHPGLKETRDFIDLILFTRAEISALSKAMIEAKVMTEERYAEILEEEVKWFTESKAKQLNVGVSDVGLSFLGANRN